MLSHASLATALGDEGVDGVELAHLALKLGDISLIASSAGALLCCEVLGVGAFVVCLEGVGDFLRRHHLLINHRHVPTKED